MMAIPLFINLHRPNSNTYLAAKVDNVCLAQRRAKESACCAENVNLELLDYDLAQDTYYVGRYFKIKNAERVR